MGKIDIPAPVPQHDEDGNGIVEVTFIDGRKTFRVFLQPVGLPQEHLHNPVPHIRVFHDDEVPGLHVGTARRPAPGLGNTFQHLAGDGSSLLEAAHAAPLADDVDKCLVFRGFQVFITPSSYTGRSRRTSAAGPLL